MDSPNAKKPHSAAGLPPSPPLSPPAKTAASLPNSRAQVKRALDALILRQRNPALAPPFETIALSRAQYRALLRRIQADAQLAGFVDTKARLEYDCNAQQLTLRMPCAIHDAFCDKLGVRIRAQLATLAHTHPALRGHLNALSTVGTRTIRLDNSDNELAQSSHSPDLQFQYPRRRWPSPIIEVAFSQKSEALPRIAADYLHGSAGNIRAVIAFDLGHQRPEDRLLAQTQQPLPEARVRIWREGAVTAPDGSEQSDAVLVLDEPFRTPTGDPAPGPGLTLPLSDFIPARALPAAHKDTSFTITHADLAADLAAAELLQHLDDTAAGDADPPEARGWRKRKVESSEGEQSEEWFERGGRKKRRPDEGGNDGARALFPIRRRSARLREVEREAKAGTGDGG